MIRDYGISYFISVSLTYFIISFVKLDISFLNWTTSDRIMLLGIPIFMVWIYNIEKTFRERIANIDKKYGK